MSASRRMFLSGLIGFAAPAILKAQVIMPIRPLTARRSFLAPSLLGGDAQISVLPNGYEHFVSKYAELWTADERGLVSIEVARTDSGRYASWLARGFRDVTLPEPWMLALPPDCPAIRARKAAT